LEPDIDEVTYHCAACDKKFKRNVKARSLQQPATLHQVAVDCTAISSGSPEAATPPHQSGAVPRAECERANQFCSEDFGTSGHSVLDRDNRRYA
jgi:hypothetical protein